VKARRPVAPLVGEVMTRSFSNAAENLCIALQAWRDEPGEEPLHQLRVALRRLRALFRVFADEVEGCEHGEVVRLLREAGDRLGTLRDLDVMLALCRGSDDPFRDEVIAVMEIERQKHMRKVRAAGRWSELERAVREFSERLPACAGGPGWDVSWRSFCRREARDQIRRILKSAGLAKSKNADELHAFRKKLRRLRYLGETMAAHGDSHYDKVIANVHACEQRLGKVHDLDMALTWVRERYEAGEAAGLEAEWMCKRAKRLKRFRSAWAKIRRELAAV
jgi:CHAD domain-containing protein